MCQDSIQQEASYKTSCVCIYIKYHGISSPRYFNHFWIVLFEKLQQRFHRLPCVNNILDKNKTKKQRSYFSNFGSRVFCCISVKSQTYLHNQDILCRGKKKKSFLIHQINSTRVYILHNNVALTLPVNVDRSSPPMTLISPVDWSFC